MLEELRRAIAAREPIRAAGTDALRLVDGAGDRLDGLEIDAFAGRWLVQTRGGEFPAWLRGFSGPVSVYWKQLGEQKQAPARVEGAKQGEPFVAVENGMRFLIDFAAGYSQGVFLDQRENRAETRRRSAGLRVLNCFAYTCGFGVAAALGGGETVNIDLSKHYLDWGRRNYEANGIGPAGHGFIYGDALNWMERFARKGRQFDVVILDPPTFSRDKQGKVFTVENGFAALVQAAAGVLTREGTLFCSTNQRTLTQQGFQRLISDGLGTRGGWKIDARPMPPDFTGEQYLKACWVTRR